MSRWLGSMLYGCVFFFSFPSFSQEAVELGLVPRSLLEDLGRGAGVATSNNAPPIMPIALDMIKDFEGWVDSPSDDPVGYCTVGYGHLVALKPCSQTDLSAFTTQWSKEEGARVLEADTRSARIAVNKLVQVDLTEAQFSALAVFTFNVGKENFATSTLLKLVNDRNFDKASQQFGRWVNAKGKKLQGLVERRACEAALFEGSLDYNSKGGFDRAACRAAGIAASSAAAVDVLEGEK